MIEIKRIRLFNHPVVGNINLDLGQCYVDSQNRNEIFTTVVIGENGIGKSYILKAIVDIFRFLYAIKANEETKKLELNYRYELEYVLHQNTYVVSTMPRSIEAVGRNVQREIRFLKNGDLTSLEFFELPERLITSTMTLTDKFNSKSTEKYYYKGLRSEKTAGQISTRSTTRKVVESIVYSLKDKINFKEELRHLLDVLGLDNFIMIKYKINYKEQFFQYGTTPEGLKYLYDNQKQLFTRSSKLWGTDFFNRIRDDWGKINDICNFIQRIKTNYPDSLVYNPLLDNDLLIYEYDIIKMLTNLDVITYPELIISKKQSSFEFENSSSGETQQLWMFLGIMSVIKENSLVIIDEPENSSHPNWQMNFIGWLMDTFKYYINSHFIIATHSHFLLTNLKPETSRIIALEKDENGVKDIAEGVNAYCWSVDDILYRVFHVRNTRNKVFERNVRELYNMLTDKKTDTPEFKKVLSELKKVVLNQDDPLLNLIRQAENVK